MNWEFAELYSRNNEPQRVWAERTWSIFREKIKVLKTTLYIRSVIDFGCGTGEITEHLGRWVADLENQ